jgi:hypothetical protein
MENNPSPVCTCVYARTKARWLCVQSDCALFPNGDAPWFDTPSKSFEEAAREPISDLASRILQEQRADRSLYGFSAVKANGDGTFTRVNPQDIRPSHPAQGGFAGPVRRSGVQILPNHATYPFQIQAILDFEREVEICCCTYVIMGDSPETTEVRNDAICSGEHRRDCPAWEFTWRRRLAASFDVELRCDE